MRSRWVGSPGNLAPQEVPGYEERKCGCGAVVRFLERNGFLLKEGKNCHSVCPLVQPVRNGWSRVEGGGDSRCKGRTVFPVFSFLSSVPKDFHRILQHPKYSC